MGNEPYLRNMTRAILATFAALVLLTGCDPSKRLFRFCHKHPELCARDTVRDTVWATVEYVKADTTFVPVPGDTVYLFQGIPYRPAQARTWYPP